MVRSTITAEEELHGFQCLEPGCKAPARLTDEPFTMDGTSEFTMQRAGCDDGHWYHVTLNVFDLPDPFDYGKCIPEAFRA